jgi:hypothetical protein
VDDLHGCELEEVHCSHFAGAKLVHWCPQPHPGARASGVGSRGPLDGGSDGARVASGLWACWAKLPDQARAWLLEYSEFQALQCRGSHWPCALIGRFLHSLFTAVTGTRVSLDNWFSFTGSSWEFGYICAQALIGLDTELWTQRIDGLYPLRSYLWSSGQVDTCHR